MLDVEISLENIPKSKYYFLAEIFCMPNRNDVNWVILLRLKSRSETFYLKISDQSCLLVMNGFSSFYILYLFVWNLYLRSYIFLDKNYVVFHKCIFKCNNKKSWVKVLRIFRRNDWIIFFCVNYAFNFSKCIFFPLSIKNNFLKLLVLDSWE